MVKLYAVTEPGPKLEPKGELTGAKDIQYTLDFAPDNKTLATAGYDRIIRLWDTDTLKVVRELKDHSDTIYGVAFSPDGKLLASASADRAVKVWDPATGKRLYTLGDPTDWVYALAWHPDGKRLAAAGVDKSIRVWEANADSGKLVHSVFAHTEPVTKLAYSQGRAVPLLDQRRAEPEEVGRGPDGREARLPAAEGDHAQPGAAAGRQAGRGRPVRRGAAAHRFGQWQGRGRAAAGQAEAARDRQADAEFRTAGLEGESRRGGYRRCRRTPRDVECAGRDRRGNARSFGSARAGRQRRGCVRHRARRR